MIRRSIAIINEHSVFAAALTVTLLIYSQFIFYGAISWDDPEMVFKNQAVKQFDIYKLISGHFVGNYIPVTMILHAVIYKIGGEHAGIHHLVSILLHLINGLLVYRFLRKCDLEPLTCSFTAAIFLLHPLQIESAGWISELKNLSWTFFALLGMSTYLDHRLSGKQSDLLLTFIWFILACFSKPSAVIFPVMLFLLDLFLDRKIELKKCVPLMAMCVPSLIFGMINMKTQAADQFINYSHDFPMYQKAGFAGFALLNYLRYFIFPFGLSVLHPFPVLNGMITVSGYLALLSVIAFCFLLIKKRKLQLLSLVLIVLLNLILVLQFIPFGESLFADRYMYFAVIFFALIPAFLLQNRQGVLKKITFILIFLLGAISFLRGNIWKDGLTLYSDILKKYPDSFVALNSYGVEQMMNGMDSEALVSLEKAVAVQPKNHKGHYNRGLLLLKMNRTEESIESFNNSIAILDYTKSYIGRASAYYQKKDYSKAMKDAEYVLGTEPENPKAYFILGNCYNDVSDLPRAISFYNKAVEINGNDADFYFKRAIALGKMQDFRSCLKDLDLCLFLNPKYTEAYYWRGVAKINLQMDACEDLKKAAAENITPAIAAYQKYCR